MSTNARDHPVTVMLFAPTQGGHTPVNANLVTLEMESIVNCQIYRLMDELTKCTKYGKMDFNCYFGYCATS